MSLAAFQQLVDDLVRDRDQVITSGQRSAAIGNAVLRYSADAPRVLIEDVTSVAGGQRLPVPTGWVVGRSELRGLEYPVGKIPASEIGLDSATIYQSLTGPEIVLLLSLFAGDVVRVTFTGWHVLTETTDSIPPPHQYAVACLAASILCGQLSAYYATEGSPTLQADTVDHLGKTERYRARARDLAAEYTRIVGNATPDSTKPAMAVAEFPSTDSLGGKTLFHPPRRWPR